MLLLALLGCESTLEGQVRADDGTPVAGAALTDGAATDACSAVTAADGSFRTRCAPGPRTFAVSHPDYLPGTWEVAEIGRGTVAVGSFTLTRVPTGAGLWALTRDSFLPLTGAALTRAAEPDAQRWCVPASASPVTVTAGAVRLLDAYGAPWRVYALDAERCAYRLTRGGAEHWAYDATRMGDGVRTPISEGRDWVVLELPPGDYAVVDWYEGFLVRQDAAADTWRAAYLRVGPPGTDGASKVPSAGG